MWKLGNVTAQFLFWEYLFPIFGIGSLQCAVYVSFRDFKQIPSTFVCQLVRVEVTNAPLSVMGWHVFVDKFLMPM
jgi:hypothetical protein